MDADELDCRRSATTSMAFAIWSTPSHRPSPLVSLCASFWGAWWASKVGFGRETPGIIPASRS